MIRMRAPLGLIFVCALLGGATFSATPRTQKFSLASTQGIKLVNVTAESVTYNGRAGVHVDLVPGEWTKVKIEIKGRESPFVCARFIPAHAARQRSEAGSNQRRDCLMGGTRNGCAFLEFENYEVTAFGL